VNVVNIARQIQRCRGWGQMYSVTKRHQSLDPASARYLIASNSAWDRGAWEQQPRVTVVNIVNVGRKYDFRALWQKKHQEARAAWSKSPRMVG